MHCRLRAALPFQARQHPAPHPHGSMPSSPPWTWRKPVPAPASHKRLPCKGSWRRPKAPPEGCIAALRRKYPSKPGSTPPRIRRARCHHLPPGPGANPSPFPPHTKGSPARGAGGAPRRRLRGALPPCGGTILPNPAAPCPASAWVDARILPRAFPCFPAPTFPTIPGGPP